MGETTQKLTLVVATEELQRATEVLYKDFVNVFGQVDAEDTAVAEESKTPLDLSIRSVSRATNDLYRLRSALQREVYTRIIPEQPSAGKTKQ